MTPAVASGRAGVVFDIDGTLLDTNYLHVLAWSAAFCDNGFRVEMADIHRSIGRPSEALVEHLVGQDDRTWSRPTPRTSHGCASVTASMP